MGSIIIKLPYLKMRAMEDVVERIDCPRGFVYLIKCDFKNRFRIDLGPKIAGSRPKLNPKEDYFVIKNAPDGARELLDELQGIITAKRCAPITIGEIMYRIFMDERGGIPWEYNQ